MKKIIKILFLALFLCQITFAEITDFGGDFSSRSQILKQMNSSNPVSQEQKDILKSKKLALNPKCLINEIEKGNIENVKILLDSKINPNDNYFATTPIFVACQKNKTEIAKLLLEHGAKLEKSFDSELYFAVKNKNKELAHLLINYGANVNYSTPLTEKSILYVALNNKMYDIAQILIEKGAKPDRKVFLYIKKHKLDYLIPEQ